MLYLRYLATAIIAIMIPAAAFCVDIPGLEGLKEISDNDLEEICGSIMPDDKPQLARSVRPYDEKQQQDSITGPRTAGRPDIATSSNMTGRADDGFDVKKWAESVTGGFASANIDTSDLNENVTLQKRDFRDMLTPGNVLGAGGGFDYSASGVVKMSNPTIGGVDTKQFGDFKAAVGVNVSATVSIQQ